MRRRTGRTGPWVSSLVGASALFVLAAGCSGGTSSTDGATAAADPGTSTSAPNIAADDPSAAAAVGEVFSVLAGEGVAVDLDDLAASLEDRLVAAGQTGASVEVAGDRVSVDPGDGALDQATLEDLVSSPGRLELRPVIAVQSDCEQPAPTGGETVRYPELDESGAVVACYTVAPSDLTNDAVEDATATIAPSTIDESWLVNPIFTATGIETFNDLARECNTRSPVCPSQQLAVAVDGIVLSAPTVNEPSFERDQIQISGDFTEAEAKALAAAVRAEPLPNGLEVVE